MEGIGGHLGRTSSLHILPGADSNGHRFRRPIRRGRAGHGRAGLHRVRWNELLNPLRSYACFRIGQVDGLRDTLRPSLHYSSLNSRSKIFLPLPSDTSSGWNINDRRKYSKGYFFSRLLVGKLGLFHARHSGNSLKNSVYAIIFTIFLLPSNVESTS